MHDFVFSGISFQRYVIFYKKNDFKNKFENRFSKSKTGFLVFD